MDAGCALWVGGRRLDSARGANAHLFQRLCVKQDPAQLNNLGRVLRDIDAVLVTGGRNVDDHVAVDVERRGLQSGHGRGWIESESGRRGSWYEDTRGDSSLDSDEKTISISASTKYLSMTSEVT